MPENSQNVGVSLTHNKGAVPDVSPDVGVSFTHNKGAGSGKASMVVADDLDAALVRFLGTSG